MPYCLSDNCKYFSHSTRKFGDYCCKGCKEGGGHGPMCEKQLDKCRTDECKYCRSPDYEYCCAKCTSGSHTEQCSKNPTKKTGLFIFLGESFRTGDRDSRIIGEQSSFGDQMKACNSHIQFLKTLNAKHNINTDVLIATYETPFIQNILLTYSKYLVGCEFYKIRVGLNKLFHDSIKKIKATDYQFICYIRIDIYLKEAFSKLFNPSWDKIIAPSIFKQDNSVLGVNDMMLYIPRKHYAYLKDIYFQCSGHSQFRHLINTTNLKHEDLGIMLQIVHNSNSVCQKNPLYYIANRPESHTPDMNDHIRYYLPHYQQNSGTCDCTCKRPFLVRKDLIPGTYAELKTPPS